MTGQATFSRVAFILRDHVPRQAPDVTPETDLRAAYGLDSLDLFSIACDVEEEFGVSLSDDHAIMAIRTVADLVALVEAARAERAAQLAALGVVGCNGTVAR